MDLSHLDRKYFLDERIYNCPFCNRGSVSYEVVDTNKFDWLREKPAYAYIVQCGEESCQKRSMHLSYFNWIRKQYLYQFSHAPIGWDETKHGKYQTSNLDLLFFFHQPSTFFTLDSRVKRELRDLVSEADGCLKMNFLVGASACTRKTIYVLLDLEKCRVLNNAGKTNYQDSIKALKEKFGWVSPEYFDALASIQELSSDNVHEGSWKAWDAPKIESSWSSPRIYCMKCTLSRMSRRRARALPEKFLLSTKSRNLSAKLLLPKQPKKQNRTLANSEAEGIWTP